MGFPNIQKIGQVVDFQVVKSPMMLIGPAYSGKSDMAIDSFLPEKSTLIIGTGQPQDLEFTDRISDLREQRPRHWQIVNEHYEPAALLAQSYLNFDQILVDSINQWIANLLVRLIEKHDLAQSEKAIQFEIDRFTQGIEKVKGSDCRLVMISNEAGAGVNPAPPLARLYRKLSCQANYRVAKAAESVILINAGIPLLIKP